MAPGFKGFLRRPLGPCSGFKAKRRGFSISFSFLLRLEDFIGLLSWGTLTYYRWSTKLRPVLQSKGGGGGGGGGEGGMQLLSLLKKTDVHCVCG